MLTDHRIKEIASLSRKKHRDAMGQCVLEGVRSLASAIDGGAEILDVVLQRGTELLPSLSSRLDQPVHEVDSRAMAKMSDTRSPSGLLAVVGTRYSSAEEIAAGSAVLFLDGIQDPGNVGTLIRSAAWFGVHAVVAGPGTADFFNPKTLRASMGGVWDVALHVAESSAEFLSAMKAQGRRVWVADMEGVTPSDWAPGPKDVLVLGSEAHGAGPWVVPIADGAVCIPRVRASATAVESLNVAAAGAVLLASWAPH